MALNGTWILIPAFNEEKNISRVLKGLQGYGYSNLLVVDDGSYDGTSKVAAENGARVIRHPVNLGVGAAIKTGLCFALQNQISHIIQIDGDGQHNPVSIEDLIRCKSGDLVIGQRNFDDFQISPLKRFGRYAMIILLKFNGVTDIFDPTSGFRLFRSDAIRLFSHEMPSNFFGDTLESLIIAKKNGVKICGVEVEMSQRYLGESSYTGSRLLRAFLASIAYSLGYWKISKGE